MVRPRGKAKLLGVGLDNEDGQARITRGPSFDIVGGSHETHEAMQEKCIKFDEKLQAKGKELADLERQELHDLAAKCRMNLIDPRRRQEPGPRS